MMTESTGYEDWNEYVEAMTDSYVTALEENVEAQAAFVDRWLATLEDGLDEAAAEETAAGYARAYEAWMDAAREQFERIGEALQGEDVRPEEFRDLWMETANEAFAEVMSTPAFAAVTGETVEGALALQQEVDDAAQDTLHRLGFATEGDVREVGDRLLELERRQHDVETKLDRVLEHLEE